MNSETTADHPGATAHLSPLLMKARRLGLVAPEDLERLAVRRGCLYYGHSHANALRDDPGPVVSRENFSNAELAVALTSPSHPASLQRVRIGAAMLSASDVDPVVLVSLAEAEGCSALIKHIADCGRDVEPTNPFWERLLTLLPDCRFDSGEMPHPTRFFEMTGITRGKVGIQKRWIRPLEAMSLNG